MLLGRPGFPAPAVGRATGMSVAGSGASLWP